MRTRVARGVFESARTHEAVQLPASVADLHAALPKVNADDFAHGYFYVGLKKATAVS